MRVAEAGPLAAAVGVHAACGPSCSRRIGAGASGEASRVGRRAARERACSVDCAAPCTRLRLRVGVRREPGGRRTFEASRRAGGRGRSRRPLIKSLAGMRARREGLFLELRSAVPTPKLKTSARIAHKFSSGMVESYPTPPKIAPRRGVRWRPDHVGHRVQVPRRQGDRVRPERTADCGVELVKLADL